MRIVVDLNRCQGYAQCVPLAPDVLKLNGEEALAYDPNPEDTQRLRVLRAAASCPVQAIIVDQLDEPGKEEALREPDKRKRLQEERPDRYRRCLTRRASSRGSIAKRGL